MNLLCDFMLNDRQISGLKGVYFFEFELLISLLKVCLS